MLTIHCWLEWNFTSNVITVGIIDYLITFGLKKLMESFIKTSKATIIGENSKSEQSVVTIIRPEEYKTRFKTRIEKYFLTCPFRNSRRLIKGKSNKNLEEATKEIYIHISH